MITTPDYSSLEKLSGVYLEDSYVLAVWEGEDYLLFELDAVLTPKSPGYTDPNPGEQYCYMRSELLFDSITRIEWRQRTLQPYRDATGEVDYGNIDVLEILEDGYRIEGDWGSVRIWSEALPQFEPGGNFQR
ncbi:hypothetical protein ACFWPH_11635 [Nocardia sp. NPDC058499]|uniref:hypothetical protein n=1 Tax=Nocardia sp. NPDC058499 TaxID=3346530 RepID=UPI00364F4DD0